MSISLPPSVAKILSDFDSSASPTGELEIIEALRPVAGSVDLKEQSARDGWFAESAAFHFSPSPRGERSVWDTYFGPRGTITAQDDSKSYFPDLQEIDQAIVEHWERRTTEARHPVLRARYADLLWDLKPAVTGKKPDARFARVAIAAYLEAVERQLYRAPIDAIRYVARALDVAVSLNDDQLVAAVRDASFSLHDRVRDPAKPGYCLFLFDLFLDEYRRKAPLTQGAVTKLVHDLEDLLRTWSNPKLNLFDPHSALGVAKRLIGHYRREGTGEAVRQTAQIAGRALEDFAAMGDALLGTTLLQDAHRFYQEHGLREDADRAIREAKRRSKDVTECMGKVTTTFEIDRVTIDKAVDELTTGEAPEVVARIVREFLPTADAAMKQLEEMKTKFPLLSNLPQATFDGLTRAGVGAVNDDVEGRTVQAIAERLSMETPFLAMTLQSFIARHGVTAESLWSMSAPSPIVSEDRKDQLLRGAERYLSGDWISAVHVLTPLVEETIRRLLGAVGGITEKREGAVYMAKDLGALVADPLFKSFWTQTGLPDVPLYLRTLLTDQRGWNVRNRVAHGLCSDEFFTRRIADRLVHVVLLLGMIRPADPADGDPADPMDRSER